MTQKQWCKTNYHSDGQRRFGKLTNGLCDECCKEITPREKVKKEIAELIRQRALLNTRINRLRKKYEEINQDCGIEIGSTTKL